LTLLNLLLSTPDIVVNHIARIPLNPLDHLPFANHYNNVILKSNSFQSRALIALLWYKLQSKLPVTQTIEPTTITTEANHELLLVKAKQQCNNHCTCEGKIWTKSNRIQISNTKFVQKFSLFKKNYKLREFHDWTQN
jgi:hypothetical protein